MKEHRGVLVLVLGIVSLVVCQPVGIAAWIMGKADLAEMDAGTMDPTGRQMTNIGMILGIIAVALMILSIVATIAVLVIGVGASAVG